MKFIQKVRNGKGVGWCLFRDKPLRNFQGVGGVKLTPLHNSKKNLLHSCIFEHFSNQANKNVDQIFIAY